MPRKTKEDKIQHLEKLLALSQETIELLSKRNSELVEVEEGTFIHSPTYLQMKEEISFLKNLKILDEYSIASANGRIRKADSAYRQVYEDNVRLTSENADIDYFVGITENFHEAYEYQKLKNEIDSLNGKLEQKEILIKNQENEILRLREKLSVSRQDKGSDQVGIIQHNARNAGRKKNSESETHKVIFERFEYLMESQASMDEIIETMGISRATYYRYKKELVKRKKKP